MVKLTIMNLSMILTLLGSTAVGALATGIFSTFSQGKNNRMNHIVQERQKWRESLRGIMKEIKEIEFSNNANDSGEHKLKNIKKNVSELEYRLNTKGLLYLEKVQKKRQLNEFISQNNFVISKNGYLQSSSNNTISLSFEGIKLKLSESFFKLSEPFFVTVDSSIKKYHLNKLLEPYNLNVSRLGKLKIKNQGDALAYASDTHIWLIINEIYKFESYDELLKSNKLDLLSRNISALLKFDWDRSKEEVNGNNLKNILFIIEYIILLSIIAIIYYLVSNYWGPKITVTQKEIIIPVGFVISLFFHFFTIIFMHLNAKGTPGQYFLGFSFGVDYIFTSALLIVIFDRLNNVLEKYIILPIFFFAMLCMMSYVMALIQFNIDKKAEEYDALVNFLNE